jgi:hypothetical protein
MEFITVTWRVIVYITIEIQYSTDVSLEVNPTDALGKCMNGQ